MRFLPRQSETADSRLEIVKREHTLRTYDQNRMIECSLFLPHGEFLLLKLFLSCFFFLMFIYFWQREREQAGEGQRERETRIWSRLSTVSAKPNMELKSWTVRSQPEPKLEAQLTEPPRCPFTWNFLMRNWPFLPDEVKDKCHWCGNK